GASLSAAGEFCRSSWSAARELASMVAAFSARAGRGPAASAVAKTTRAARSTGIRLRIVVSCGVVESHRKAFYRDEMARKAPKGATGTKVPATGGRAGP